VGAEYRGDALLILQGQVMVEEDLPPLEAEVRVAVFWSSRGGHGETHQQEAAVLTDFPAQYTLSLYTPPPDEVLYQPDPAPSSFAVGLPLIYEDIDGNGRFDSGIETVVGGAEDAMVIYFPEPVVIPDPPEPPDTADTTPPEGAAEPLYGDIEAGYHAVTTLAEHCHDRRFALALADPLAVDLAVGDVEDILQDMECDDDLDEWDDLL